MKNYKLVLGILTGLSAANFAAAEGSIGNGGGAWVCQNNDSLGTIRWAKLVDLYEAQTEFKLAIPEASSRGYSEIINQVMIRKIFPISRDLYQSIQTELEMVLSQQELVDADLEIIEDALYRIKPRQQECVGGIIHYTQLANYTNYGKILIQQGLFQDPRLSETHKAALLIHEAVYAYLRKSRNDKDSVRARRVVGLLFSSLTGENLKKEMEKVLGSGFENQFQMEFVSISPGTFLMGSPESEAGHERGEILHRVTLTQRFEMQTTTVTQAQWVQVMGSNPSYFQDEEYCPDTHVAYPVQMCPNHPVEQISFDDVQSFIGKMNSMTLDGYFYRLPTEAEWEYVARSGTQTPHYFEGTQINQYAWYDGNSGSHTHEVAKLKPNAYGLYDMLGNVWQWVQDWHGYYSTQDQTNPPGAQSGHSRVTRGGGWSSSRGSVRSAYRGILTPGSRYGYVGFRLARGR